MTQKDGFCFAKPRSSQDHAPWLQPVVVVKRKTRDIAVNINLTLLNFSPPD